MEHVVEARDGLAVGGSEIERLSDFAEGIGRKPAVALLREPESGHDRRASLRIPCGDGLDLVVERARHQRSQSPITVSREPRIAIRSATREPATVVAVAS